MGGIAILFLTVCYWLLDVMKWGRPVMMPFRIFGLNPIAAYVLAGIFANILIHVKTEGVSLQGWIYQNWYLTNLSPFNASFCYALTFVLLIFLPVWGMYKKGIVLKV